MRFKATLDPEDDPGTWYVRDTDDAGKPIRYLLRKLPGPMETKLLIEGVGNRKMGQDELSRAFVEREVAKTRKRAAIALVDSENLVVEILNPALAAGIGAGPEDKTKLMDGTWTDSVRDFFLRQFPGEATWIAKALNAMAHVDREQEADESKT